MQRDYGTLVNLALKLKETNAGEREQRTELNGSYVQALETFVDDLLTGQRSAERATREVNHDLDEISSLSDPELHSIYDKIRYDIINRIEEEAGPKPWQQTVQTRLVGLGGVLLVVLLAAGYFGLRQYSTTPVTARLETKAGIEQRANALAKVLRYEDWGSGAGRRGGFIKNILLWPIEPTKAEIDGASELGGLIFAGAGRLRDLREACNLPVPSGETIGDEEITLLQRVTTHLRAEQVQWKNPPAMTVLDPIRAAYPC
jgi:hypothetical protein